MHSAYAGAGGGAALVVCGLLSVSGSYKLYMIGVHLALLLQLLFVFVFALQVPPAEEVHDSHQAHAHVSLCARAGL